MHLRDRVGLAIEPGSVLELCNRFDCMRDPRKAARILGVMRHQKMQGALQQHQSYGKVEHMLKDIVYCIDADMQLYDHFEVRQANAAQKQRVKSVVDKKCVQTVQKQQALTARTVEIAAMMEHSKSKLRPGHLYSLPSEAVPLVGLQYALARTASTAPALRLRGRQCGCWRMRSLLMMARSRCKMTMVLLWRARHSG